MHERANDPAAGIANAALLSALFWLCVGVLVAWALSW